MFFSGRAHELVIEPVSNANIAYQAYFGGHYHRLEGYCDDRPPLGYLSHSFTTVHGAAKHARRPNVKCV